MRRRDFLKAAPALMAPALAHAQARPLRYIPNAGLSTIDPIWTTALVAGIHGYMVYDTLYGLDDMGQSRCHVFRWNSCPSRRRSGRILRTL